MKDMFGNGGVVGLANNLLYSSIYNDCMVLSVMMHGYLANYLLSGQIVAIFDYHYLYLFVARDIFTIYICIWYRYLKK